MTDKTRLGPGGLSIILGMLAILGGAILLPVVLFGQMPEFSRLKSEGQVVDAVIVAKQTMLEASTQRRQAGSSENFLFVVSFDPSTGVPFDAVIDAKPAASPKPSKPRSGADIVAALDIGGPTDSPATGALTRARVNAGSYENFERYQTGETISITYLPDDPAATRLTQTVRAFNPLPLIALAVALLAGGILSCLSGWKKRVTGQQP